MEQGDPLTQYDGCPYPKVMRTLKESHVKRQRERASAWCAIGELKTRLSSHHQKSGRGNWFYPRGLEGAWPHWNLIFTLLPHIFCCFNHPVCGPLLRQPWEKHSTRPITIKQNQGNVSERYGGSKFCTKHVIGISTWDLQLSGKLVLLFLLYRCVILIKVNIPRVTEWGVASLSVLTGAHTSLLQTQHQASDESREGSVIHQGIPQLCCPDPKGSSATV